MAKVKGLGRKRSIDLFCKECIYDPLAKLGTWRQQTEACPSTDCQLYFYRPLSRAEHHDIIVTEEENKGCAL